MTSRLSVQRSQTLFPRTKEATSSITYSRCPRHGASSYTQFFAHVAAHERFYRVMLCSNGVGSFQARLQKHFADSITTEMQRLEKGGQRFSVPLSLLAQFYAGAILSSLLWWFSQDLSSSPEQMGNYLKRLLGETIPGRGNAR